MLEKQNDSKSEMLTDLDSNPNVTAIGKYPIKTGSPEYNPSLISDLLNIISLFKLQQSLLIDNVNLYSFMEDSRNIFESRQLFRINKNNTT